MASAAGLRRLVASSARLDPSSERLGQVAMTISLQASVPCAVRQRPSALTFSAMMRSRVVGSEMRARNLALPPSCTHGGRIALMKVLLAA